MCNNSIFTGKQVHKEPFNLCLDIFEDEQQATTCVACLYDCAQKPLQRYRRVEEQCKTK